MEVKNAALAIGTNLLINSLLDYGLPYSKPAEFIDPNVEYTIDKSSMEPRVSKVFKAERARRNYVA